MIYVDFLIFMIFSMIIISIGFYSIIAPNKVSDKIKSFYGKYPFTHNLTDKQRSVKAFYIRILGGVLLILGIITIMMTCIDLNLIGRK